MSSGGGTLAAFGIDAHLPGTPENGSGRRAVDRLSRRDRARARRKWRRGPSFLLLVGLVGFWAASRAPLLKVPSALAVLVALYLLLWPKHPTRSRS